MVSIAIENWFYFLKIIPFFFSSETLLSYSVFSYAETKQSNYTPHIRFESLRKHLPAALFTDILAMFSDSLKSTH
jgi:hypothetical protein